MKKYILTILIAFCGLFSAQAQEAGINFLHCSWQEAVNKAKAENKLRPANRRAGTLQQ